MKCEKKYISYDKWKCQYLLKTIRLLHIKIKKLFLERLIFSCLYVKNFAAN